MGTRTVKSLVRELENSFVPSLIKCAKISGMKKIHAHIVKLSLSQSNFLVTKMVDLCSEFGEVGYATSLFEQLAEPNVFSCNAMIRTFTRNHQHHLTITMFKRMLRDERESGKVPILPNEFTFPFVIRSCSALLWHSLGNQIHGHVWKFGLKSNSVTENALIDMHSKFGDLGSAYKVFEEMGDTDSASWNSLIFGHARLGQIDIARRLFDEMPCRTIVSWTAMITGYCGIGCYSEALDIFRRMQMVGIEPDEISVISVLPACAMLGALEVGKWIHMYSDKKGFLQKTGVCNALVEMYAKCGCIDEAKGLFDQLVEKDVISWSTMIGGLANHGKSNEAIELFQDMQHNAKNVTPNGITFLGVLSACTHAGLWSEGLRYFDVMRLDYHIAPEIEHYGCLVDVLGRSGRLEMALDTMSKMPMKPDSKIWNSLLSSCRIHRNLEVAIVAMEKLLKLEPEESGNYVLLANIYAELGKWECVSDIRKIIRRKGIKKTPGCSSIEVNNVVDEFVSGDDSKPFSQEVFWVLEVLVSHQTSPDELVEFVAEDDARKCHHENFHVHLI